MSQQRLGRYTIQNQEDVQGSRDDPDFGGYQGFAGSGQAMPGG
jgi:hypothetical protein